MSDLGKSTADERKPLKALESRDVEVMEQYKNGMQLSILRNMLYSYYLQPKSYK